MTYSTNHVFAQDTTWEIQPEAYTRTISAFLPEIVTVQKSTSQIVENEDADHAYGYYPFFPTSEDAIPPPTLKEERVETCGEEVLISLKPKQKGYFRIIKPYSENIFVVFLSKEGQTTEKLYVKKQDLLSLLPA